MRALASTGVLPAPWSGLSGDQIYAGLLSRTLGDGFSTTEDEDIATLEREAEELPPHTRLALSFRVLQKRGLREELERIR